MAWLWYGVGAFCLIAAYVERKDRLRAAGFLIVGGLSLAAVISWQAGYWDI